MSAQTLVYPTRDELLVRGFKMKGTPAERIRRAYVVEATGCWRWTGGLTSTGYGHPEFKGHRYQAHLLVYILEVGPLPKGLEPDHLCRNRWCVNPGHLEFVTHAVNTQRGNQSTLTPEQVDEIRLAVRAGASQRALAPLYGIDHSQISKICSGKAWADRPFPTEKDAAA